MNGMGKRREGGYFYLKMEESNPISFEKKVIIE